MFSNKTTLLLCAICYSLLIFGGILNVLSYYLVLFIIAVIALLVLIQLVTINKVEEDKDIFN